MIDDGNLSSKLANSDKFHKVLELVGVTTLFDSMACCVQGGIEGRGLSIVCNTGIAGNSWMLKDFNPMEKIPQGVALTKYSGGPEEMKRVPFADIVKQVEAGHLTIAIGKTWTLDQVGEAHEVMEKGGAGGKMVILME